MRTLILDAPHTPLRAADIPTPKPGPSQILVRVHTCGICRTDLHIVDGELPSPKLPLILGHQIVGTVIQQGPNSHRFKTGDRIGIPWLGKTCGTCRFCLSHRENLCEKPLFTGYTIDGGFAEYTVADENYCFAIPENYTDLEAAPLLCGGLIGFRALRMAQNARRIGFYGIGSSAHILIQIARHLGQEVYAFTRPGDTSAQALAKKLDAVWTGTSNDTPPLLLDAAIIFAPVGDLIPKALASTDKGGRVISAGIHMSDIPTFPYSLLYSERTLTSVTNLTREDGNAFFHLARQLRLHTHISSYPLEQANQALHDLKAGNITGSAVLQVL